MSADMTWGRVTLQLGSHHLDSKYKLTHLWTALCECSSVGLKHKKQIQSHILTLIYIWFSALSSFSVLHLERTAAVV